MENLPTIIIATISSGVVGSIVTAVIRRRWLAASIKRLLAQGKKEEAEAESLIESTYARALRRLERRLKAREDEGQRLEEKIRELKQENTTQTDGMATQAAKLQLQDAEIQRLKTEHQRCEEIQIQLRAEIESLRAHHEALAKDVKQVKGS